jgi:hypothetical protein
MPLRSMYAIYTFFSFTYLIRCSADKTIFGVNTDSLRKIAIRINYELIRCKDRVPGRLADLTSRIPLAGDKNTTKIRVV